MPHSTDTLSAVASGPVPYPEEDVLGLNGPPAKQGVSDGDAVVVRLELLDDDDPLGLEPAPAKPSTAKPLPRARRVPGQNLDADGLTEYDGPLRYLVRSRKRPEVQHLVQLDAYRFNGSCGCEDFSIPLLNKLRAGAVPSDDTRCYHIKKVRSQLLDWFINEVSRYQGDTTHDEADGLF